MNFVKSNYVYKLRAAGNLLAAQSSIASRNISTASPPLLNQPSARSSLSQLPSPYFTTVRHIRTSRDPSTRYLMYHFLMDLQIVDPKLASYGVENPLYAVIQLAQTTMRSELGKITLDKTFEERDTLNEKIVIAINEAAKDWGLQCLRYEISGLFTKLGDISPPRGVRAAMEMQAEAERKKRAQVLESEGERQANINIADGKKNAVILASEASKEDQVNRALGEAEAILARAQATAKGIAMVSKALEESGGTEAASLRIAEQYIQAFGMIAKESTTVLLPSNVSNPANMMAQALSIYKNMIGKSPINGPSKISQLDHVRSNDSSWESIYKTSSASEPADQDNFASREHKGSDEKSRLVLRSPFFIFFSLFGA
ncbi:SPFH/Band 7/PHB domain-containingmembrane-associated protein family [Striga asiatica]|uniref:SPFH/Band 7/PHB domain-containingmembrane-associated protein family n=1 Tax=Striga asiatica TaxID=4170 RepID=A0A5A7PLF4_STRAF|nr:SPFH/Band 7/PHB domain-containingmembrane-associated protein family [Striga asiatica]